MRIKNLAGLAMAGACLVVGAQVQAQGTAAQEALYVRSLAATCANCHGTDGKAQPGPGASAGALAGLDPAYFVAQMKAFKSGARPATVMHQLSKGFSDAQVESLAGYFAAQKK